MSLDILDSVRVCLAGPSWWADYWHLPAIQNHPDAEIVGVCGEKARDAAEVRARYGDSARYFTDIDAMLDATKPDGLIVCTPNDLHYPATMAALNRGIHVVCEKPIAMNETQAREMAETAEKGGLLGLSNFTYRGNPALQQMQKMVAAGFAGTPLHLSGVYYGGYAIGRPPGWRGNRERSGSGILGDLGSHLIDMARFVTGQEFAAVCAHNMTALWNETPDLPPRLVRTETPETAPRNDDSCAFLAEFTGGLQGIFHTSWIATMGAENQRQQLELYGTKGRLRFYASFLGTTLESTEVGAENWETVPIPGITRPDEGKGAGEDFFRPGRLNATNNVYRWLDAIQSGRREISPSLTDGWRAQQVIDAVLTASAERRWTDVEEV